MRVISFKTLTVRNFLSVGSEPIVINFQSGINVITGINYDKEDSKNGVGKSTVVDALHFALFGSTIRELSKDLIVNSYNKKHCEVKLELQISVNGITNNYTVTRSLGPTKCSILKDGVDVTRSTLPKTNEYIQQLVNSTSKIFQNTVVMTINNTVPFMAQSKVDKRKFIESTLNLEVFSEMLLKAREQYNELKREYDVVFAKKTTIDKTLEFNLVQLNQFNVNKQNKIKDLEVKIENNNSNYTLLKNSIIDVPVNIEELISNKETELNELQVAADTEHTNTLQQLTTAKFELETNINNIKEIEKVGSSCKLCQRPYSEEDTTHRTDAINKLKEKEVQYTKNVSKWQEQYDNVKENIKYIKQQFRELQDKKDKIKDLKNKNIICTNKLNIIEESNNEILRDIESVKQETNTSLEENVKNLTIEQNNYIQQIDALDLNLNVLDSVKFVVSEEGVKAYIVKKILKLLNARLAHYLNALHANCLCQFNEFFDEQIIDENNEVKSYFNFSGGERKRIDLACLFAFLDIRRLQGDINFSTIFYDELLDSSLDDKGVELVMKVLRERLEKYNEGCYIITHRSNAINSKVDSIIQLEKRNGFTYILNNNEQL